MKLNLVSTIALCALLTTPAFADGLEDVVSKNPSLTQYDNNKDGVLSTDEVVTGRAAEFTAIDTDADGFLTWFEFKAAEENERNTRVIAIVKAADKDANGQLTPEEFANVFAVEQDRSKAPVVFAIIDTDANNVLSSTELAAALAENGSNIGQMWRFANKDTNADAKISKEEYIAKPVKLPVPPKLPKPNPAKPKR